MCVFMSLGELTLPHSLPLLVTGVQMGIRGQRLVARLRSCLVACVTDIRVVFQGCDPNRIGSRLAERADSRAGVQLGWRCFVCLIWVQRCVLLCAVLEWSGLVSQQLHEIIINVRGAAAPVPKAARKAGRQASQRASRPTTVLLPLPIMADQPSPAQPNRPLPILKTHTLILEPDTTRLLLKPDLQLSRTLVRV